MKSLRNFFTILIIVAAIIGFGSIRADRPHFTVAQMTNTNDRNPYDYYWSSLKNEAVQNTIVVFAAAILVTAMWIKPSAKYITQTEPAGQGMIEYALILVLVAIVIVVCLSLVGGLGQQAVKGGELSDTIFSTEPRANGTYSMWMVHDSVGVYCTLNQQLYEKAHDLFLEGKKVLMHYDSVSWNDPENGLFGLFGTGCSHETTTNTSATVYRITAVEAATAQ